MSKSKGDIKTWAEVTAKVQNTSSIQHEKLLDKLRKISYRNSLQAQMEQHSNSRSLSLTKKQQQRRQINNLLDKQKQAQLHSKLNRLKTEKWYQKQNEKLYYVNNRQVQQSKIRNQSHLNNQGKSLADSLIEGHDKRKSDTTRKFKLQNYLNDMQIQMKKTNQRYQKTNDQKQSEKYNKYVENEFQKIKKDRELWKNKYLRDRRSARQFTNDKAAYKEILDREIMQKVKRKKSSEVIDDRLSPFNRYVEYPDNSPAYLGRVSLANDRKRQLNLLDKHISFNPRDISTVGSKTERRHVPQTQINNICSTAKQVKRQPKIDKIQRNDLSLEQLPQRKSLQGANLPKIQSQKQTSMKKQFTSYDFISGHKKTFFL